MRSILFLICIIVIVLKSCKTNIDAKILDECSAVKELKKAKISSTFISNWVCLMKSESGLNTSLVKGPGYLAGYSFGVFQIDSINWCKRGRKGGNCNAKCENFADDDISDDIVCADKIFNADGFKHWSEWQKKCKGKPLPYPTGCKRRRRTIKDILISYNME